MADGAIPWVVVVVPAVVAAVAVLKLQMSFRSWVLLARIVASSALSLLEYVYCFRFILVLLFQH
mgnify:CR=1 FL=1